MAHAYANRILNFNENCKGEFQNKGFITRGADWYEILGGMQDYGYFNYGTIELTMEISCCKYPTSNLLLSYWNYNRDSMVELLYQAQRGQIDRIESNELCLYRCERFDIEWIFQTHSISGSDDQRSETRSENNGIGRILENSSPRNIYSQSINSSSSNHHHQMSF